MIQFNFTEEYNEYNKKEEFQLDINVKIETPERAWTFPPEYPQEIEDSKVFAVVLSNIFLFDKLLPYNMPPQKPEGSYYDHVLFDAINTEKDGEFFFP